MTKLVSGGTLGDTYICICHWVTREEPIDVEHSTKHTFWHQEIRDIYSLLPNVKSVTFVERPGPKGSSPYSIVNRKINEFEPFPNFKFPLSPLDPGEPYIAVCPRSGKPKERGRKLSDTKLNSILTDADMPVVMPAPDKTTLLEAMGLVARADSFYGVQGLMSFVALSHRIPSIVYVPNEVEYLAFRGRLARPWIAFLKEVEKT